MKVSLNWLRDYVDVSIDLQQLVEGLTMLGLEVEGVQEYGRGLEHILSAKILDVRQHPNADRLKVCIVDVGGKEYQVVCGAPNVRPGLMGALALPGAVLANGMEIKETKIRGQVSTGMLVAEDEVGLTTDHSGIMELEGIERSGIPLGEALRTEDYVLEVAITPNRPDCNSIIGIAREVAILCGSSLKYPTIDCEEDGDPIEKDAQIEILDPKGCPRYTAGMISGIVVRTSPFWMRYRIHKAGMRPINNIVDVTNYVMLEMGQPLHAFDFSRIRGGRIIVKRAYEGERFKTLDGVERTLSKDILMICDGIGPVAVAGIMGGLESEIQDDTHTVLLESAFFDPMVIRRGAKYLGLTTEASFRFERCTDIQGTVPAMKRALCLMKELAGGRISKGYIDCYPNQYQPRKVHLSLKKARSFLGMEVKKQEAIEIFEKLGMEVRAEEETLEVIPPSRRPDISLDVDLMEEIARVKGYENVPITFPKISSKKLWDYRPRAFEHKLKSILFGLGFTEVINYSFISPSFIDVFGAPQESKLRRFVRLLNPISIEQSVMRTSLLPGLFQNCRTNVYQGQSAIRLFEIGEVFFERPGQDLPEEKKLLAGVVTQPFSEVSWHQPEREYDYYDLKGTVEAVLWGIGIKDLTFSRIEPYPGYDPDLLVGVFAHGKELGRLGKVAPAVSRHYDIDSKGHVYAFELDVASVLELSQKECKFIPLPRFPAVLRDLSVVVDDTMEAARLEKVIWEVGGGLVESVRLFDIYQGEKIGPNKRAFGFRITYRSKERTLEGQEVNDLHQAIIDEMGRLFGARLREG